MDWLRLWHDMPGDPKWRTIARASGRSISEVMSIYCHLLVMASTSPDRGHIAGLQSRDLNFLESLSTSLDLDIEHVEAVLAAMQGRVLDGCHVAGWDARQPNRDEPAVGKGKSSGSNYVYYVVATDSDVVKVGISRNPWARVKDLQAGSEAKFELLATLKTNVRSERELHQFFEASRINEGWYRRSKALNSLIERTRSKQISSFEKSLEFLAALPTEAFVVAVVATSTTKDRDKDKDLKETPPPREAPNAPPNGAQDPGPRFAISKNWEPDPETFPGVMLQLGMPSPKIDENWFREFRSYWIASPDEHRTQAKWEHALASHLKRNLSTRQAIANARNTHGHNGSGHAQGGQRPAGKRTLSAVEEVDQVIAEQRAARQQATVLAEDRATGGSLEDHDGDVRSPLDVEFWRGAESGSCLGEAPDRPVLAADCEWLGSDE